MFFKYFTNHSLKAVHTPSPRNSEIILNALSTITLPISIISKDLKDTIVPKSSGSSSSFKRTATRLSLFSGYLSPNKASKNI